MKGMPPKLTSEDQLLTLQAFGSVQCASRGPRHCAKRHRHHHDYRIGSRYGSTSKIVVIVKSTQKQASPYFF